MLFWVTTRGRDRIFSNPRDSAIVKIASMRMLLLALTKLIPLFGLVTGRLENRGIWVADPVPVTMYMGFGVFPTITGELPTLLAPPTALGPLPHPKPNWVPISRAKLRVAATTRASISTSW